MIKKDLCDVNLARVDNLVIFNKTRHLLPSVGLTLIGQSEPAGVMAS